MSEFDFEHAYEVCPHCDTEVMLDPELKVQTCPNCGKRIVTCSMCRACDTDGNYCSKCCLCYQAEQENKELQEETPDQVQLHISTDLGFTADFLRELANAIENSEEQIEDYETFRGVAKIEWPE